MILYTQVPLESVLDGLEEMCDNCIEVTVGGVLMQVEPISPYQGKVVRLLSPDPMHYLNPAFAPGQMIAFRPV
ncbi:YlzJ-like family protein [Paenibacillus flagellatus]|uniref:Uncharacterized protein n=1 Tax=Paenibacillus flagellatus TaxID=2211139 RepID=A0A2V5K9D6_9BACL|nr:YlzJ-like family protein [Paenibacillus flagellatus]PYI50430.1 hypothetical protein DLM86_29755 [Paenibacillus flagellatus]